MYQICKRCTISGVGEGIMESTHMANVLIYTLYTSHNLNRHTLPREEFLLGRAMLLKSGSSNLTWLKSYRKGGNNYS